VVDVQQEYDNAPALLSQISTQTGKFGMVATEEAAAQE